MIKYEISNHRTNVAKVVEVPKNTAWNPRELALMKIKAKPGDIVTLAVKSKTEGDRVRVTYRLDGRKGWVTLRSFRKW